MSVANYWLASTQENYTIMLHSIIFMNLVFSKHSTFIWWNWICFFFQKRINACFTHWLHGITNPSMWIHRETGSTIEGGGHFVSPHGPWCGRRPLTVSLCKYTRHPTTICLVCKASRDLSSMLTFLTRGLGTLCVPSGGRWPRQPGWGSHGWVGCEPGGWGRWSQGSFCWLRWNHGHPIVCAGVRKQRNQISTMSRAGFLSEKCYFQASWWGLRSDHVTGRPLKAKESYRFNQCALQNVETERMNSEIPGKIITENTRSATAYYFFLLLVLFLKSHFKPIFKFLDL